MSDKKPLEPEILDDKNKRINRTDQKEAKVRVYSRFYRFALANRLQEKALSAYRRVIGQEAGLAGDMVDHRRALARLEDVDTLILKDQLQRTRELLEEEQRLNETERELSLAKQDDQLAKKRRAVEKAKLEKELRELKTENNIEESELEKFEKKERKKYQEEKIRQKYRAKRTLDRVGQKETLEKEIEERIRAKKEAVANKIGYGKSLLDFNSEEMARYQEEVERIEDEMYKIFDTMD